ncbi:MAG: cyclic nucleotide-binding domain-containing protein [Magnetococcus sp. YQC-3]
MRPDGPTICIVDDDHHALQWMESPLSPEYRVQFVSLDGDPLGVSREASPELILLNIAAHAEVGLALCRSFKSEPSISTVPLVVVVDAGREEDALEGLALGAVDLLGNPVAPDILLARVHGWCALSRYNRQLAQQQQAHAAALEEAQAALRAAIRNLLVIQVTEGVYWLQIPEAGLYILCGCPGEVVKHLTRKGLISPAQRHGVSFETGPNAILLSDRLVQNGGFANLAEFPVLQMLYRQGMILPGHPNNTGLKPLLIGSPAQVRAQLAYIYRGNYGLVNKEEILACGVEPELADLMLRVKYRFAFGKISTPEDLLDTLEVADQPVAVRNGVTVARTGFNHFRFSYRGEQADIDLNLPPDTVYEAPYPLGRHRLQRHYFAVLHTGEGDGWDVNRPSMSSIIIFQGRIYLVDICPTVLAVLTALGIDISEVEGVFHTHGHDDHFAGLPALLHSDHRIKYYATPLVRASVTKKFAALTSLPEGKFAEFFEVHDLVDEEWNDCDGLEVKPFYSPHPVETTILLVRALSGAGYQTYAHWADISSFAVLDRMTGEGPGDLPAEFIARIKASYLVPADLKKLDVGGGMIHGAAEDFRYDPSTRLVLAHTAHKLTPQEMTIGSESFFGAMDVLIKGQQDYMRQRAFRFMSGLFPQVRIDQIQMLLNCSIFPYNAGTIIYRTRDKESTEHVEMLLSGAVSYLDHQSGTQSHLPFGSLIGLRRLLQKAEDSEATYRAVSHCAVIRFPLPLFKAFLENNGLLNHLQVVMDKVYFLRKTRLFGGQTTFQLANIAQQITGVTVQTGERIVSEEKRQIWLVVEGEIQLIDESNRLRDVVKPADFFGEDSFLTDTGSRWTPVAAETTRLYRLSHAEITTIPIVHWRMLEKHEDRLQGRSECAARKAG